MNRLNVLILIVITLVASSCAQQTSPTGGPKDTIPPTLIYSFPKAGQTNYSGRQIELSFNELVTLNNPKEQIIISPDIEKKYDVRIRKNKIIIELENRLRDSTTYLLNFRDAVQDLTEKNPTNNLKLAFSTGSYVDSLSVRGSIIDPLKNEPPKDAIVALYQSDTFNIFKHKPVYLTKVNKFGRYIIQNLKPGTYYVYAFQDKNRNLSVDSKTESYGFLIDTIRLTDNILAKTIPMVRLDSRDLKITSNRPYNTYVNIKTSKGLASYSIKTSNGDTVRSTFGDDRSNIKLYNTFPNSDSVAIQFHLNDSIGNTIDSTFYIKFPTKKIDKETFTYKAENFRIPTSTRTISTTVTFTKPIAHINYDSLFIQIDSANTVNIDPQDIQWPTNDQITITKTIDQKHFSTEVNPNGKPRKNQEPWKFRFKKGAFISVEQDSSEVVAQDIKIVRPEDVAILYVTVPNPPKNYIVELLDKSYRVVGKKTNTPQIKFDNLTPGDYILRMITDINGDGQWSPGNFLTRTETEPITYYLSEKKSPTITLKANWELGPLLIDQ